MKRAILIAVFSIAATLISGEAYQRLGDEPIEYAGVDPGPSYARVVVGGWPVPYLYDSMYFSPVNSVSHSGALLGLDTFRPWAFVTNVAFYALVMVVFLRAIGRRRR